MSVHNSEPVANTTNGYATNASPSVDSGPSAACATAKIQTDLNRIIRDSSNAESLARDMMSYINRNLSTVLIGSADNRTEFTNAILAAKKFFGGTPTLLKAVLEDNDSTPLDLANTIEEVVQAAYDAEKASAESAITDDDLDMAESNITDAKKYKSILDALENMD